MIQPLLRPHTLPTASASVAIIGGGLGAFTAALSLHRAGVPNNIFIPEPKLTKTARSGAFIGGSAIRILDRLGLGSEYRALGTSIHNLQLHHRNGTQILSVGLHAHGNEVWLVPKDFLLQRLLEGIPNSSVHFACKFRHLRMSKSGLQVLLQHSHTSQQQQPHQPPSPTTKFHICNTDFVIGADGLNSSIRSFMSRSAMTLPSGVMIWRAVVTHKNVTEIPFHVAKEVCDDSLRFGFVRLSPDQVMWWAIATNFSPVMLRPFTPHLQRMFQTFPNIVLDLLSAVESDRVVSRYDMKNIWPKRLRWLHDASPGCVALIGDGADFATSAEAFHSANSFAVHDAYGISNVIAKILTERNESSNPHSQQFPQGQQSKLQALLQKHDDDRQQNMQQFNRISSQIPKLASSKSFITTFLAKRTLTQHFQ